MALSDSVKFSLEEAESHLRNALSFAARQERPMVCTAIADMIKQITTMQHADDILDKLENREPGSSGLFGNFLDDED